MIGCIPKTTDRDYLLDWRNHRDNIRQTTESLGTTLDSLGNIDPQRIRDLVAAPIIELLDIVKKLNEIQREVGGLIEDYERDLDTWQNRFAESKCVKVFEKICSVTAVPGLVYSLFGTDECTASQITGFAIVIILGTVFLQFRSVFLDNLNEIQKKIAKLNAVKGDESLISTTNATIIMLRRLGNFSSPKATIKTLSPSKIESPNTSTETIHNNPHDYKLTRMSAVSEVVIDINDKSSQYNLQEKCRLVLERLKSNSPTEMGDSKANTAPELTEPPIEEETA